MSTLKYRAAVVVKKKINQPQNLTVYFTERVVQEVITQLTKHKVGYVLYQSLEAHQKKRLYRRLHVIIRRVFLGQQGLFFAAMAQQFLDEQGQVHPDMMHSPLYCWCLVKLFSNQPGAMLAYLQKVRRVANRVDMQSLLRDSEWLKK